MRMRPRLWRSVPLLLLAVMAPPWVWAQTIVGKIQLLPAEKLPELSWETLGSEGQGDGRSAKLPDAKELAYALAPKSDFIWFKVRVHEPLPENWFGVNVALDTDGNPDNGTSWWGTNKTFKFDRLVTAYLYRAEGYWQGAFGVGDSEGADHGYINNLGRDVKVALDRANREIILGLSRRYLGDARTLRVITTVGSSFSYNDDLPNEGAFSFSLAGSP